MWYWHAIEENEHKAVAFDVYEGVFGKGVKAYALRTSSLVLQWLLFSQFNLRLWFVFKARP